LGVAGPPRLEVGVRHVGVVEVVRVVGGGVLRVGVRPTVVRRPQLVPHPRGLHSSTFRLNVSAFCGIGGASRGYVGGVYEVLGGVEGCLGCVVVS